MLLSTPICFYSNASVDSMCGAMSVFERHKGKAYFEIFEKTTITDANATQLRGTQVVYCIGCLLSNEIIQQLVRRNVRIYVCLHDDETLARLKALLETFNLQERKLILFNRQMFAESKRSAGAQAWSYNIDTPILMRYVEDEEMGHGKYTDSHLVVDSLMDKSFTVPEFHSFVLAWKHNS